VAQDPNQSAGKADPFEGQPAKVNAGADLTLAERLNARTEAEFVETPLRDVMSFLGSKHGLQIIFKQKRLEDVGIGLDIPITLQLRNIRLSTLLDVMLEDLNLVYTEKDDLVVITTPDDAQATMEVRVYDCRDLLTMPTVGLPRPGMTQVDPYGPGEFGEPGASSRGFTPAPPTREPGNPRSPPRTDDAREAPATDPFAPPRNPLSPEEPSAPRRPRNDILPQAAPGGGLGGVSGPPGMMGGMIGGAGHGGPQTQPQRPMTAEELKAEQLLRIITTAVNPDTWQEMGGPGTIGEYNGLVVVSQSARTHSKIEKVLDMLREAANLPKSKGPRVVR
jgi:general secretion pathway protein D